MEVSEVFVLRKRYFVNGVTTSVGYCFQRVHSLKACQNADAVVKKRLASHVESCELVLGVVAEPAFDADERYHSVVFAIAKALDGVIFNGQEMLDANGVTLLAAA